MGYYNELAIHHLRGMGDMSGVFLFLGSNRRVNWIVHQGRFQGAPTTKEGQGLHLALGLFSMGSISI